MSNLSNPHSSIHTQIVRNKTADGSTCHVMERKIQHNEETNTDTVLESRVIGILINPDDDLSLMIPIDEWREDEGWPQRQAEGQLGVSMKNTVISAEQSVYSPLHLFALMLGSYCANFPECEVAPVFLHAHKETVSKVYPEFGNFKMTEEIVRRFFALLGKDCNGGLLHDFSGMDIEMMGRDVRIRCEKPQPYVLNVHDGESATILAMDIVASKVTPRKDAALIDSFLQKIAVRGTVVCTDSQYASAQFVKNVLNDGGDYLVRITDSTPAIQDELAALFRGEVAAESQYSARKERNGRTETATVSVLPGTLLDPALKKKWIGMDDGLLARVTTKYDAQDGSAVSEEVCYLVSSLPFSQGISAYIILSAGRDPLAVQPSHRLLDIVCLHEESQYKNGEYLKGRMIFEETLQAFIEEAKLYAPKIVHASSVSRGELQAICTNLEMFLRLYAGIMKKNKKQETR